MLVTAGAARAVSAPAIKPAPSRWIVGPAFDLTLFILTAAVTLIPWALVDHMGVHSYYVLAGVAILSNGPHLASTWTRVYMDGRERWRRPVHYWVIPGLICAAVLAFILVDGGDSAWLRTILFYWASWHFAAQCWGLLKIYQRKHGIVGSRWGYLEKVLLFGAAGWCVLHRLFTGPWTLFNAPIWHPRVPAWLVNGTGAVMSALAIVYVAGWIKHAITNRNSDISDKTNPGLPLPADGPRAARARKGPDWRRALFIATTFAAFAVPFLLIRDGTAAFAAAACWHGFQYLGIMWFYNKNRYREGVDPRAKVVSWAAQPRRWPIYYALLLALAGLFYLGILGLAKLTAGTSWHFGTWGLLIWTSLTFSHYYLDGVIWKLRKDAQLSARLGAAA